MYRTPMIDASKENYDKGDPGYWREVMELIGMGTEATSNTA